jgi:hypothetical protein
MIKKSYKLSESLQVEVNKELSESTEKFQSISHVVLVRGLDLDTDDEEDLEEGYEENCE